jgi:WD40 repeat protein
MNLRAYSEAGGVRRAIARTAESVYSQELTPHQQDIARSIFLRLTELGEGTQDTRRRATISELVPSAPYGDPKDVEEVLVKLADARLITTGEGTAEVAHEALIREWPTLREWLDQNREGIRIHRHLTETAREWQLRERDHGELYRGARLAQAIEWAETNPSELNVLEQDFLEVSQVAAEHEAAEREAQRQRELKAAQKLAETEKVRAEEQIQAAGRLQQRAFMLTGALAIAAILAVIAFAFAREARQEASMAMSRELAAAAINNLEADPERSVLLALHGLQETYTIEAENALHKSIPQMHLHNTLIGHDQSVETLAVSPDGRLIASASIEGIVKVWELSTGEELLSFTTNEIVIFGMVFSPDGHRIITASKDHTARVWDSSSGEQLLVIDHGAPLSDVAISPDGLHLATAGADAAARVWDSKTGEQVLVLSGHAPAIRAGSLHPGGVVSIEFAPDGKRIVTGGADGTARIWDAENGLALRVVATHTNEVYIALSPDGDRLLTAGFDGQVKIWDISLGIETSEPSLGINHEQPARDAAFSPDGTKVAVASQDGAARVWDAYSGQRLLTLAGHAGLVDDLAFTPDGGKLVTGAEDKTVKVWDLAPGRERLTIIDGSPGEVTYSPDGTRLATSQADGTIVIRDSTTGQKLLTLTGHPEFGLAFLSFSPDGKLLASGSWDTTAKLWDATTGEELFTLADHTDFVWGPAFSPDGARLATASSDMTAKVWDTTTGEEVFTLHGHGAMVQAITFSPDGGHIATVGECDNTARIWDAMNGKHIMTLDGGACLTSLGYSPDGKHLATGRIDGSVIVWDVSGDNGQELFTLSGHAAFIPDLAYSPDGAHLATASFDGTAKVWDLDSRQEWLTFPIKNAVTRVVFSPQGTDLATAGFDGQVRIWILDLDELMTLAESRLTRDLTQEECQKFLHLDTCPESP